MNIKDKWTIRTALARCSIFVSVLISCSPRIDDRNTSSVLIKNVYVIDGRGNPAYKADVLVVGDRIAEIGELNNPRADVTIDGDGRVLCPGFIDLHAHGDPSNNPECTGVRYFENYVRQGVTTLCLGMDGFSDSDPEGWLQFMDSTEQDLNIVPFVGHSTLRELSGIGYNPDPSESELQALDSMLDYSLSSGYAGLSTGLEYLPGGLASSKELGILAKTLGRHEKIMMSHIRSEDDDQVESSLRELLGLAQYCKVHVSHIKVVYGKGERRGNEILQLLRSAGNHQGDVTADAYPYLASYTGIGILFPEWAKAPNDYAAILQTRRPELENYLYNRVMLRNGPAATLLGTEPWEGLTLEAAAASTNKSFVEFLIEDIGPSGASGAYFIMDEELQLALMKDSLTAIASDGSPTMNHPRGYGTFVKVLSNADGREDSWFPLEEAIRKMTTLPAGILGLKDRGIIKEGAFADLLLFDPHSVEDVATYENPHELARGIDFVMINGEIVVGRQNGHCIQAGRLLKL